MADKKEPPPPPVDPAIIAKTREALSFLQKPPLTDKLLNRPPFRFVYDVVGAVIDATHFADGLFDQGQLKLTPEEMKAAWVCLFVFVLCFKGAHLCFWIP